MPLARVPWNDPARLMKILDAGAYGVICPMINTARGGRGAGPRRASTRRAASGAGARCAPRIYAGTDYGDHANDDDSS